MNRLAFLRACACARGYVCVCGLQVFFCYCWVMSLMIKGAPHIWRWEFFFFILLRVVDTEEEEGVITTTTTSSLMKYGWMRDGWMDG